MIDEDGWVRVLSDSVQMAVAGIVGKGNMVYRTPVEPSAETMAAWLEFSQMLRRMGIQIGKQRDVYAPSKTCFEIAYAGAEGKIRFENNDRWYLTLSNDAFSLDVLAYGKIPRIKLETASLPEECDALELVTGMVRQLTGVADTADEFEI